MPSSEVIYTEASNWLRLINTICWQMAAMFIPLSIGGYVYALKHPASIIWLGSGSIVMWIIWTYILYMCINSANHCRVALKSIEEKDGVLREQRFYSNQKLTPHDRRQPFYIILTTNLVLIIAWIVLYLIKYDLS